MQENINAKGSSGRVSALEHVLACMISHVGQSPCICTNVDPQWSFSFQILTIPFLWQKFPYLKEVDFLYILLIWDFISFFFDLNWISMVVACGAEKLPSVNATCFYSSWLLLLLHFLQPSCTYCLYLLFFLCVLMLQIFQILFSITNFVLQFIFQFLFYACYWL